MKVTSLSDKRKQIERDKYTALVLKAWEDQATPEEREQARKQAGAPQCLDTDVDVRRKAKQLL